MTDDAIAKFAEELSGEVEDALSADAPFSQEIFTELILERLEEAGHLVGTFPLFLSIGVGMGPLIGIQKGPL
jgi:hypothetical protein